jgi:hypothetical protein
VKRREFITLLGGAAAAAWPVAARAQQAEQMRRIGVLMNTGADEPESQARLAAFMQAVQELGWAAGRNLRIDYRWSPGSYNRRIEESPRRSRAGIGGGNLDFEIAIKLPRSVKSTSSIHCARNAYITGYARVI